MLSPVYNAFFEKPDLSMAIFELQCAKQVRQCIICNKLRKMLATINEQTRVNDWLQLDKNLANKSSHV